MVFVTNQGKNMQKRSIEPGKFLIDEEDRAQLVHFCARMTQNREVAEDLAQESLLIALNNLHAVRDAGRQRAWLFGIARNVCLRWRRTHGRDNAHLIQSRASLSSEDDLNEPEEFVAADQDVELVLERKELIELLDRALALLPPQTRAVLIQRCVEDSPLAEIAAELGTNASAVAMRLQRGKLILHRILTQEMQREIAPYATRASTDAWEPTPLWCHNCGHQRLLGQRDPSEGKLLLKCPRCSPNEVLNRSYLPILKGIRGYKPLYSRFAAWCDHYYRSGLSTGSAACIRCGRAIPAFIQTPDNFPSWMRNTEDMQMWVQHPDTRYIAIACERCVSTSVTALEALILESPAGQQFLLSHPRIRTLPTQPLEFKGRPALLTRFESVTDTACLDVISDDETYEVLASHGGAL